MSNYGVFVGAMTGTSVDGLDLAALDVQPNGIKLLAAETTPLPDPLREALLQLISGEGEQEVERLGTAHAMLGALIGSRICAFLGANKLAPGSIVAIGSHGQTIRHRPDGPDAFTLQIGDASRIAEATNITTVADFRSRDLAAGGQAAPLVPLFHDALFAHASEPRTVVNIGGIANITRLAPGEPVSGFDTGPGNSLLDAWCEANTRARYDHDGALARDGRVDEALLASLLASDSYLTRTPPKSTGKERYNLTWLLPQLEGAQRSPADVQATLSAFTAQSIVQQLPATTTRLIVCGGGRLNPHLMAELSKRTNVPVVPSEQHGFDGDAVEAAAFAWLAHRRLSQQPGNAPEVTGAAGPRVLGAVYAS